MVVLTVSVLYVNNIAYTCRNIDSSKRSTAPLKGGLGIWKCTLHSFKGRGATFQGILHICLDIVPAKTPQRKVALIQKDMFVLNTAFVGRHWDVVIVLKSSTILCKKCVLLKGHCSSIYPR